MSKPIKEMLTVWAIVVIVLVAVLIWQVPKLQVAQEREMNEVATTRWEVIATKIILNPKQLELPQLESNSASMVRLWIKPVDLPDKETIFITLDSDSPQIEEYLKIRPRDQLYFYIDKTTPDQVIEWGRSRFDWQRLWTSVPPDLQKILPGDWRRHPEYKEFNFEKWYREHPRN